MLSISLHHFFILASPWPFSTRGIDIVGKITPPGQGGHEFILVAIDYFTKWVEVASFVKLQAKHVAQFIETNIICRYGVPHEIISENGTHFQAECEDLFNNGTSRLSNAWIPSLNAQEVLS